MYIIEKTRSFLTKYVGEYSDELYNLILNNSIKSKTIKKQIREINKKLKQLNYTRRKSFRESRTKYRLC